MIALVTGGAGFIGSRLCARLLDGGDDVIAVDDLSLGTRDHLRQIAAHPKFRFVELDVRAPAFAALVADARPRRVFHFAANSDISAGTRDPRVDLDRTFSTTWHVLEAMRPTSARELVFASTSAIYGEADGALAEDHGPLAPISLYGASKLAAEAYVSAYAHLYDFRAWVFRFPNVVGPNLTHGAIYDFVERLARDRTRLQVLGDGTQEKPYLDVDDLLDAIVLAIDRAPATYNVAGDGATTVRAIAELVREALMLPEATIEYGVGDRGWPGDVPRFAYDTSKIRALGWSPRHSSTEAVKRAIAARVSECKR